ncbi:MAG: hypothetical protein LBH40_05395 [Alphaproteobacteria bacterium]|jgi:hypothetical protein|nr:hypothetical protein [Alphaproteobacteria bacterium]
MLKFNLRDKVKINIKSSDLDPARNLNDKILIIDNHIPTLNSWIVLWVYEGKPYSSIIKEEFLDKVA